jgi:hypothetical protein
VTVRLRRAALGPALVIGDTLAARLVLYRDAAGAVTSRCPTCGQSVTDSTAADGGPHVVQLVGDVAYGPGVCVPCGHLIGAIEIEPGPTAGQPATDSGPGGGASGQLTLFDTDDRRGRS